MIHYRYIKNLCKRIKPPNFTEALELIPREKGYKEVYLAKNIKSVIKINTYADRRYYCNPRTSNPIIWLISYFSYGIHNYGMCGIEIALAYELEPLVKFMASDAKKEDYIATIRKTELYRIYAEHLRWKCEQHGIKKGVKEMKISYRASTARAELDLAMIIAKYIKYSELWQHK